MLYKFIVWACWAKTQSCLGSKPKLVLTTIICETERNLDYNSKLGFQFCAMFPKLFILKEFCFLILESNVEQYHKYSSK